jgi:hypothetical protein
MSGRTNSDILIVLDGVSFSNKVTDVQELKVQTEVSTVVIRKKAL